MRTFLMLLLACLLGACASVPQPLRGEFPALTPEQAADSQASVRWGGRIIEVLPAPDRTCLEVLGQPLDPRARPRAGDEEIGRFRACKVGFLDPAVFAQGRQVTVTGLIDGSETRQLGEYSYRMPRVAIDELMLWPEPAEIESIYLRHDPFFWNHPWWPSSRVIIIPNHTRPGRTPHS